MRFHLISIGGAVMHNIALALQKNGHEVTGSDDEIFEPSRGRLKDAGLLPRSTGWDPARITPDIDVVILGMHARQDNPELKRALDLKIPVQSFPEFVYERAAGKLRVVIGGSHGKTTTTAMIMHALKGLGMDFDYLVGSQLEGFDTMVRFSDAPVMVIEGDEYLTSAMDPRPKFHWYRPQVAVLTGIAWDHINVFPTYAEYVEQFRIFSRELAPESVLFYYENDDELRELAAVSPAQTVPYSAFRTTREGDQTLVIHEGREYPFSVFGEHNFQNMKAAFLVCCKLGEEPENVIRALSSFKGTARRLEIMHDSDELVIIRDFAHSPSKVEASTEAVKGRYPDRRLIAVLELHTFSSLNKDFIPHYRDTLKKADNALVYYDPHVIEHKKLPAIDDEFVAGAFGHAEVFTNTEDLKKRIRALTQGSTVILMMSSGNFAGLSTGELMP